MKYFNLALSFIFTIHIMSETTPNNMMVDAVLAIILFVSFSTAYLRDTLTPKTDAEVSE